MRYAKVWPYSIATAIFLVFLAAIATVVVSLKAPVHESDLYMIDYHDADNRANEILQDNIDFNKKYTITYETQNFKKDGTVLKYSVKNLDGSVVDDAKIKVKLTRPDTHDLDKMVELFKLVDGVYESTPIKLEKEGRWDVIAKVSVEGLNRYLSIKTSTQEDLKKEF